MESALKFSDIPPLALSAAIAGVVSLVVSVFSPYLKHGLDKRFHKRKLEIEYAYEQRKLLKDRLARYKGQFLEAGGSLEERMSNFYLNESKGWLEALPPGGCKYGYYQSTFAYRILKTISICRAVENQALYLDPTVALEEDKEFLASMKLYLIIWSAGGLFRDLEYDGSVGKDHIFRDVLSLMAESFMEDDGVTQWKKFNGIIEGDECDFEPILELLDGVRRGESGRYRFDRMVAMHLVLCAILNNCGYKEQRTDPKGLEYIAGMCENKTILRNLKDILESLQLDKVKEYKKMIESTENVITRSLL